MFVNMNTLRVRHSLKLCSLVRGVGYVCSSFKRSVCFHFICDELFSQNLCEGGSRWNISHSFIAE